MGVMIVVARGIGRHSLGGPGELHQIVPQFRSRGLNWLDGNKGILRQGVGAFEYYDSIFYLASICPDDLLITISA
jgi:hypothetical protein